MKTCSVQGCEKPHHTKGYCGMHAQRVKRYGRTDFAQRTYTKEYFEYCLKKQSEGCWAWEGVILSTGYGQFFGKLAHRVAYEFYHGPIPEGLVVMHSCDNKACVNPAHLSSGTYQANTDDMMAKKRHRVARPLKACENPLSKFTEQDVRDIRQQHAAGTSMRAISRRLGVHHKTISGVIHGRRYIAVV